jgi:hypothetical protein
MARPHKGAGSARGRRLSGFERLEERRVLSALPWAPPVHAAAAAFFSAAPMPVAAIKAVDVVQRLQHGPTMVLADAGPFGTPAAIKVGGLSDGPGGPKPMNGLGLNQFGALTAGASPLLVRPTTFVLNSSAIQSFDTATAVLRPPVPPLGAGTPPDPASHDGPLSLVGLLANSRGGNDASVRLLAWMAQMAPGDATQGQAQGGPFDFRGRFAQLAHDTLFAEYLARLSDSGHSAIDDASNNDASLDRERHGINPALFGQSAGDDSMFAGAGRSVVENQPAWLDHEMDETSEAASHLVAVGDTTAAFASAVWAAGSRALGAALDGDGAALDSALHDLLAPRFAFDAATLSDAIGGLVDEADELGISLLGLLADPAKRSEMALLAAVVAGLAYRHWRGQERRAQAESRSMLAARFVTGPSLRFERRDSP